MTTLKIHDLNHSPALDTEAMARIRGGGEPKHSFIGLDPVLSTEPQHSVATDGEPTHSFQLGW